MRLIQATTITKPITIDDENVVIAAPDGSRLIINADIKVTNGTLMIGGDDVIIDSSRISVRSVNKLTGKEEVAHLFLETNSDLYILGSNMGVCGNFSVKSKHNLNVVFSSLTAHGGQEYADAIAQPLKQHPFNIVKQELKQYFASKSSAPNAAAASSTEHESAAAAGDNNYRAEEAVIRHDDFTADFAKNLGESFGSAMSMGESPFIPDHS